ncbi:hypothetical protein [Actinacidiphila guanduensis]|uniref:Uncharacterized protein n=1 Tax=Actinacidiphila guanduensis TaxID=310781 RepID=A0A1H0N005_9ACTN|nr:hypothetical protein [Actinacidiphila guanduensis]SDO85836.1 hypothetical protein SAMN05216259_113159 [Actinacidiphila guanduensis]
MGFSGELVFGRSGQELLDAPVFGTLPQEVRDAAVAWRVRPGGWRTLAFGHGLWDDPDAVLAGLVEWTAAPACLATVFDSQVAVVKGLVPGGPDWQAYLNQDAAARLWVEEPDDVADGAAWTSTPEFAEAVVHARAEIDTAVPAAAEAALAWAKAAGLSPEPDPAPVEHVLRTTGAPAEALFTTLLDTLGFPQG